MLNDDILKALIEGIIYVAPEPVTLDGIVKVLEGEERERVKAKLEELVAEYDQNSHGIQIRQVANGYKFSTKAEHHEILRKYVKSLKAPVRLSKPALETLAVIAYRQPVTVPEIEEIRGVDSGGVIHTLLEKKLVVTAGRKTVVGRPILYRTSKDFLVHFGLKDVGELPSLKEFEELAKRALGIEWAVEEAPAAASGDAAAPSAEAGAAAAEAVPETSPEAPLPAANEAPSVVDPVTTETAPAEAEEAGAASTEAVLEAPSDAPHLAAEEASVVENPEVNEPAPVIAEESRAVTAETALETPAEAPLPVAEETGAASMEAPMVLPPEPAPPTAAEAPSVTAASTDASPTDTSESELSPPSADITSGAAPEPGSEGDSMAPPEEV